MDKLRRRVLSGGVIASLIIVGLVALIAYNNSSRRITPLVYANNDVLQELWSTYKANNIEASSGRTLDKSQNNITTSEGQSYTMLRAVWSDDQATFDKSWKWTKDNLQRDDFLMSWKFGRNADGNYAIQQANGGENTASDGDSDIALSLLMAYNRWQKYEYLYDAKPIIENIWQKEVVMIKGQPVLTADDLERNDPQQVIVNPSYLSPATYKLFAKVDKTHDWTALADNSYTILTAVSQSNLDRPSSSGLPPDWVAINRLTGAINPTPNSAQTTNFGYDAIRTPWRLALDYEWFKDPRDKTVLANYDFLQKAWATNGKLASGYAHDGNITADYESPAVYGATLSYFDLMQPATAKKIYDSKVIPLYDPNKQGWKSNLSYYDDNWAYFGIALHLHALPNLTEQP